MRVKDLVCLIAFVLIFTGAIAHAQKVEAGNDYDALETFLPGEDDGKILLMIECTTCHSAASTQQRIAARAGGDITFWTTLIRRMVSSWNAKIPDEDIQSITAYLVKYFGPSSPAATDKGKRARPENKSKAAEKQKKLNKTEQRQ